MEFIKGFLSVLPSLKLTRAHGEAFGNLVCFILLSFIVTGGPILLYLWFKNGTH